MAVAAPAPAPAQAPAFALRSAALTLVSVVLKTGDLAALATELEARISGSAGLFEQDPVVVDLSALREQSEPVDFDALVALLRSHSMVPVAVKGGSEAQMAAALAAGLGPAPEGGHAPPAPAPAITDSSSAAAAPPAPEPLAVAAPRTLVIDRPLRSGQQVYARGGDLVVLGVVNFGAEVIADGSIHVYAPLRGRAIAGAKGDAHARIYTTCMEPQLISIAGTYRTSETALPADVLGKPAQVRLDGERLVIEPLITGTVAAPRA